MGARPCPIVPIPKVMEISPTSREWPASVRLDIGFELPGVLRSEYEKIGPPSEAGESLTIQVVQKGMADGAYELQFEGLSIRVMAADAGGFSNALATVRQCRSERFVPRGQIVDSPALGMRGFHVNFESYRRLDLAGAMRLIDAAAAFKLNTLLVEYGPRFPFHRHTKIVDATALSRADIEALNLAASERGISIIPLQQSIAHLDYLLMHEEYAHLREREPPKANTLCPSHPRSLEIFKELAGEIIAAHPGAKHFHLGGDEARKIGQCPRCAPLVKTQGIAAMYGNFIGAAARWVLERGLRPIVWDDTLCAFPEAIALLPKETIIAYWDYIAVSDPTPVLIPRMAHAAGGPRVAHDWRWSLPGRSRGLSDVQRGVMDSYSSPTRLKTALGAEFMREFSPYLGDGFPKWIRALPYLEYYQSRGHEVILCPSGIGNGDSKDGTPNFVRLDQNIALHGRRAKENGKCMGVITTAWYNMPPEMLYHPLIRTAQCTW